MFSKETQNPFSDSLVFKNPIMDFPIPYWHNRIVEQCPFQSDNLKCKEDYNECFYPSFNAVFQKYIDP